QVLDAAGLHPHLYDLSGVDIQSVDALSLPADAQVGDVGFDHIWLEVQTDNIAAGTANNKFVRGMGSFVADGFAMGDKINVTGFTNPANNGRFIITAISGTGNNTLTVNSTGLITETVANRTVLAVASTAAGPWYRMDGSWKFRDLRPALTDAQNVPIDVSQV